MLYGRYPSVLTTRSMSLLRYSTFSQSTCCYWKSYLKIQTTTMIKNNTLSVLVMQQQRQRHSLLRTTTNPTTWMRLVRNVTSPNNNHNQQNNKTFGTTLDHAWELFVASAALAMGTASVASYYYYFYMFDASSNPLDRTCPIVQCEGKKEEEMESEDEMDETAIPYATMSFLQTITTTTTTHPSWKLLFSHPPVEQPPQNHPEGKETSSSSSSVSFVEQKGTHHKEQPYDVSVRAIKGGRLSMEDEYFVGDGGRFVAVFDGHGGAGVSQYLRKHLYDAVKVHLQKCHWEESELEDHTKTQASALPRQPPPKNTIPPQKSTDKIPSVFSHAAALKAAFAQIDKDVLANESLSYQGSTAVAVVVHEGEDGHRTLLSANVGDSRAILSRRGRAVDLTRDHKPNDDKEKARILAMGETIEWDQYSKVHRVRNLSLSRAIGDRYAKPVVTGEAEIKHYPVLDDGDEFILLASDGLWDVMTSDEVVSFVHQRIKQELERDDLAIEELKNYKLVLRRNMAKFVAREAIRRGSGDNVCVIMVWLNDLHRKN